MYKDSDLHLELKKIFDQNYFTSDCSMGIYYTYLLKKIV